MWGTGSGDSGRGGRFDTEFLEQLLGRHPVLVPVLGIIVGGAIILAAFLLNMWRIAAGGALFLIVCIPLLVIGLVRKARRARQGVRRCPRCGAAASDTPGFGRYKPDWVNYEIVTCKQCGAEWTERG